MTNPPDPRRDDALLDAVLGDEAWTDANAAAKNAALAEFQAVQRRRRLRWQFTQTAAGIMFVLGTAWGWHQFASPSTTAQTASVHPLKITTKAVSADAKPDARYITEAQMLAMFPKGSCTIAEIDGKRQVVFLDPTIEADGAPYPPRS